MNEKQNGDVAKNFLALMGQKATADDIAALFTEDVVFNIPGDDGCLPWIGNKTGRSAVVSFVSGMRELTEPIKFDLKDVLVSETRAVILVELTTKVKATGKVIDCPAAIALTVIEGKISRFEMMEDSFDVSKAARTTAPGLMSERFKGKTVIVTGASSGIGEGSARRFAAEGANVVLVSRTKEKLEKVAHDLEPARTLIFVADVSVRSEVDAMVKATIERFGQIDVLHSNAGVGVFKTFEDTTTDDWHKTFAVDVEGYFHCAQAALPFLKKTKGNIIHTASASGLGADWNFSAYNAAKGAVVNFTRALALDLGQYGVRVNAVAPSLTESEVTKDMIKNKKMVDSFIDRMGLKRFALPADIAGPIAFLASEDACFVTGVILPVDGGVTAGNGQPRMPAGD